MAVRASEPGILQPRIAERKFDYRYHEAPADLADLVENFWTVTWSLPSGTEHVARVLPYPSVNASVTNTEADVTGLVRKVYERRLVDSGYAVGARFRPACFRPLVSGPVARLTDRHHPISEILGRSTAQLAQAVAATESIDARVVLLADFLRQDWPAPDELAQQLAGLVGEIARDRSLTRVAQVAGRAGVSIRTLQRNFVEYVGAGPKWVLQRCRLQDAAARTAAAEPVSWADLAVELGFADQAHLTRVFTATLGTPPATYARQSQTE